MTFEEILEQAIAMLQRRGRLTYRTLRLQFHLMTSTWRASRTSLSMANAWRWMRTTASSCGPVTRAPHLQPPQREQGHPLGHRCPTPPYLAEKILTSRRALEGERKQVTVLFADLKGNTELIRDLDPEVAQTLLDTALQCMMDAVHRFEGTVNDVAGDGLMAMFGAPIAHEDHALRACYAALAMQAALRRYAEDVRRTQGLEVLLRVGLNSACWCAPSATTCT